MHGQVRLLQSPGREQAQAPGLAHRGPLQGLSLRCPLITTEGQPLSLGLIQQVWGGVYRCIQGLGCTTLITFFSRYCSQLDQNSLPGKPLTDVSDRTKGFENQAACTSMYKNKSHMKNFTKKWAKCFNLLAASSVASTQVMPPFTRWQDRWPLRPAIWDPRDHQHLLPPTTWRAPIF